MSEIMEENKKFSLEQRNQEISEQIVKDVRKRAEIRREKREKEEELDVESEFDFLDQVGTVVAGGLGATIGMLPGSLERTTSAMTTEMAIGGIAGALLGAGAVIGFHRYRLHKMKQEIEKLDREIKILDGNIYEGGQVRSQITNEIKMKKTQREARKKKEARVLEQMTKKDELSR